MSTAEKDITRESKGGTITIGTEDARALREKVASMKRAALNIQANAKTFADNADGFIRLLDLIIDN